MCFTKYPQPQSREGGGPWSSRDTALGGSAGVLWHPRRDHVLSPVYRIGAPPRRVGPAMSSRKPDRPLSILPCIIAMVFLCVAVAGCRPLVGGEAGEQFQGTLEVNDRGCLTLHSGDRILPFILPDSDGLPPANDVIELPDGQRVTVGDSITTDGVSWRLSSRPEGASIAERCGYDLGEDVAEPME